MKEGKWCSKVRGQAVYASGLPLRDGLSLVTSLENAMRHMVLDDISHSIFAVMLDHPFDGILDWHWWQRILKGLSPARQ